MNNKYIVGLILLFSIGSLHVSGQSFYVYFADGEAIRVHDGEEEVLYKGMEVNRTHSIKCNTNSQLVLIDENGHNIKIQSNALFTFENIKAAFEKTATDDIMTSYFSYVWKKLFAKKSKPSEKQMKAVGGVTRAIDVLMRSPADSAVILGNTIDLQWESSTPPYHLQLIDSNDSELLSLHIKSDTTLQFSSASTIFKHDEVIYWRVTDADLLQSSKEKNLFFLPNEKMKKEIAEHLTKLEELIPSAEHEVEVLNYLLLKDD
jgi:hypothetical protein